LPGGERAIHEVWRIALAALDDAYDGAPPTVALARFGAVTHERREAIRRLLAVDVACPRARGVGRWFDVFGALGLRLAESRYEGEVATAWSNVADPTASGRYACTLDLEATPWEIDPRPALRAAVGDILRGERAGTIAARFHRAVVKVTAEAVRTAAARRGWWPVVLTGGCFQNPWLSDGVVEALSSQHPVYRHRDVPPGDGGLSLGQVIVADRRVRSCV